MYNRPFYYIIIIILLLLFIDSTLKYGPAIAAHYRDINIPVVGRYCRWAGDTIRS